MLLRMVSSRTVDTFEYRCTLTLNAASLARDRISLIKSQENLLDYTGWIIFTHTHTQVFWILIN